MVRVQQPDDAEKLDLLIRDLCEKHGMRLYVEGWSRKTYDVFLPTDDRGRRKELVARIESLATTNGRVTYFDDRALPFCEELGSAMEENFRIDEAVLEKQPRPHY